MHLIPKDGTRIAQFPCDGVSELRRAAESNYNNRFILTGI